MSFREFRISSFLFTIVALGFLCGSRASAAGPPAPTLISPANGSAGLVPFALSWSPVTDVNGITGYNWQISPSPTFNVITLQSSTLPNVTQATVSGLTNGVYYWRVDAADNAFFTSPYSAVQSFTVTGAGPTEPVAPVLNPPKGYNTFHPREQETWTWNAVPGAVTYTFEFSTDPNFSIGPAFARMDNIATPTTGEANGIIGTFYQRVRAIGANGIASVPSNVQICTVSYTNPLPPGPKTLTPANGSTQTFPITLHWSDVPNPQLDGYNVEIATDSQFKNIEDLEVQLSDPSIAITTLSAGQKFWRVNSYQGASSPDLPAVTPWSATGTFTVPSTPPKPVSIKSDNPAMLSGETTVVELQLTTPAPAGGLNVQLTSSNPAAVSVPATITMGPKFAWTSFNITANAVSAPTVVTLTATCNGASASSSFSVLPPNIQSIDVPAVIGSGITFTPTIMLNGAAGPGGTVVNLFSSSPDATVPATATVPAGYWWTTFPVQTRGITTTEPVTLTAMAQGLTVQKQFSLTPQVAPSGISLDIATLPNPNTQYATTGVVSIASPIATDVNLLMTSSNPAVAPVGSSITIPAGYTTAGFSLQASPVTTTTPVTISVTGLGVTKSTVLTVGTTVTGGPNLSSVSLNPSTVTGGNSTQGTVVLTGPAPAGGLVVTLFGGIKSSVPATLTIPAGATSATFTVTTQQVSSTEAENIEAQYNGGLVSTAIIINPTPSGIAPTALTFNPTTVRSGDTSQGTVTMSGAAPAGGAVVALFSSNTSAATVPATVTVPAGQKSAKFSLSAKSVSFSTPVNVSASYNGARTDANLTIVKH